MTRIQTIVFDQKERLLRATIRTPRGTVKVSWCDVCGDWSWFTTGDLEAKKLAVSVIERIEHMVIWP